MLRQVIVLSVTLLVVLVASYVTWTDEGEELDDTEVAMYRAEPDDINSITWNSTKSTTTITRRTDEFGDYYEVDSVTRRERKRPIRNTEDDEEAEEADDSDESEGDDAEASDEAEATDEAEASDDAEASEDAEASDSEEDDEEEKKFEVEVEETEKTFVGNVQASDLWENFAPLMALRELVVTDETDTSVFGLEDSETTITVVRGDKTIELTVGAETYGSKDLYVGYAGRVFLVDNKTLQPLEFAGQRLVERALHPVDERDAVSLDLSWPDGTQRTWTHEERAPKTDGARPTQVWASTETPDEADEAAATWIDKLLRLRLREYLDSEAEQALVLEPVFNAELHDEEKSWTIEVFRATDEEGEPEWYARTDYNRGTVMLTASLAREVTEDLGNLRP